MMLGRTGKNCFRVAMVGTIAATLFACLTKTVFAEANGRFCIVPVKDGAPTEKDIGQAWRISDTLFLIPGLPGPVFTPANRGGQWTIDADRRLVAYRGPFPRSYLDKEHFVLEPWSQRVVAIT